MPKLTVSWDENRPVLQIAEVENPMSDRRWSAPVGQMTDEERQELLSAAQALAQLIADLAQRLPSSAIPVRFQDLVRATPSWGLAVAERRSDF
jgi:hypothetical protein